VHKAVYSFNGRHFCDGTDKNGTVELEKLSPIGFVKFLNQLSSACISVLLHKGITLKEMWIKCLYSFVFIINKASPGMF